MITNIKPDFAYSEWNLDDELKLLNAIIDFGYGNWGEISLKVPPHSASDCERHYLDRFILNPTAEFRPALAKMCRLHTVCSNNCKFIVHEEGSRGLDYSKLWEMNQYLKEMFCKETIRTSFPENVSKFDCNEKTLTYHQKYRNPMVTLPCRDYNRIRSDFTVEYDNDAEKLLRIINEQYIEGKYQQDELSDLITELQCALFSFYNLRLEGRRRRKNIVRNHGLIDRRKTFTMLQRLDILFDKKNLKVLLPLLRFLSGPELDFLVERMKYQNELRLKLNQLVGYRNQGIRFLSGIETYEKLKNKRHKDSAELLMEASNYFAQGNGLFRKPTLPLTLYNLPGYHLLNEEERNLCSRHRVVPETFTAFKKLLIAECEKNNGLRLAHARQLIKIDVNKTRKIYDFLKSKKLIWPPE